MQRCITALFICALLSLSHLAFGQASVNENLETAFIYVDGAVGSDSNSGTQSKPLKTIGAAASMAQSNNQAGIGSRVIINPGTYRESISLKHNNKDTSLPMTFQAATNGTVTISGGKLYTGWATYQGNSNIYTNGWLNDWGKCPQLSTCPFQQEIMMRREMVAVNGTALTQVSSQPSTRLAIVDLPEPDRPVNQTTHGRCAFSEARRSLVTVSGCQWMFMPRRRAKSTLPAAIVARRYRGR